MQKSYSWNASTCICDNRKYLKSIADTSVIACDESISVMDIVSTKMTTTIETNISINFHPKKGRCKIDCYLLHKVLLVIILLLIITVICYHYAKHSSKQKDTDVLKMKNNEKLRFLLTKENYFSKKGYQINWLCFQKNLI